MDFLVMKEAGLVSLLLMFYDKRMGLSPTILPF